jgi:1,4-alpha-glucan branching enzyme
MPWFPVVFVAARILSAKVVVDVFDDPALPVKDSRIGSESLIEQALLALYYLITRLIIRRCDAVVCALEPFMLGGYGVPDCKLVHVTNGVDLAFVEGLYTSTRHPLEVFHCGFPARQRGGHLLLDAIARVRAAIPEVRLVAAGDMDPAVRHEFECEIVRRGISENVTVLGTISSSDVIRRVYQATVCVFPKPHRSELEGTYPIKVLEYMAAGRAMVATDLVGVRRLTADGEAALLVPAEPEAMSIALVKLLTEEAPRVDLEASALRRAQELNWPTVQAPILSLIDRLLHGVRA